MLDNCHRVGYPTAMLTINDVETILGISYPTALALAKDTGTMNRGKWYIPADVVAARIDEERKRVDKMSERYHLALQIQVSPAAPLD